MDKEYIVENCQDKQRLYDIDICMLQTEPCKRAVEQNRCPKMLQSNLVEHWKFCLNYEPQLEGIDDE